MTKAQYRKLECRRPTVELITLVMCISWTNALRKSKYGFLNRKHGVLLERTRWCRDCKLLFKRQRHIYTAMKPLIKTSGRNNLEIYYHFTRSSNSYKFYSKFWNVGLITIERC